LSTLVHLSIRKKSADSTNDDMSTELHEAIIDADLPWAHLLSLIPLCDSMFIAGSAATWLAERLLFDAVPMWTPSDIDVFMCHTAPMFHTLTTAWVVRYPKIGGAVIRRINIVDVSMPSPPNLSFVRCNENLSAADVTKQFDIDICTPIVIRRNGALYIHMTAHVASCIRDRIMHCIMRQHRFGSMHYPVQKSLTRLRKYQARGYALMTLTFESTVSRDFPEFDCMLNLDHFDNLFARNLQT
jgi:hypothetical protein